MKKITTQSEYEAICAKPGYQVMVWSAAWCPDCVFIKPFMPEVEADFKDMHFYEVDRDDLLDEAIDLKILGIPSFIVYKDGKEAGRFVSKLRKTKAEIEAFLKDVQSEGGKSTC